MKITREFLLAIAPSARSEIVNGILAAAPDLLERYEVNTTLRVAHFFGQAAEETGAYNRLEENLYYTSTARLRQVWPSRFKSDAAAAPYVRNPKALANLVYNGRMGNRVGSNDGYDYRGSGDLQATGRSAFEAVDKASSLGCLARPEVIRTHPGALESALIFWRDNGLNKFADADDIMGLTKRLNGGYTNIADRRLFVDRAKRAAALLASGAPLPPAPDVSKWLRRGDSGSAVITLQRQLQAHGFYVGGKLDGVFGDGTEDAVRHFQAAKGLTVDGVVGPATRTALEAQPSVEAPDPHTGAPDTPTVPKPDARDFGIWQLLVALVSILIQIIFGHGKG